MTAATLSAARSALLAVLATVPTVGIVHSRERFASSEAEFRKLYLYSPAQAEDAFGLDPHIRGWYVRRTATTEVNANGRILNEHRWLIRGYMAFKDAVESELVFDDLVERIRSSVRVDITLGLPGMLGGSIQEERGVQVASAGPVMFAGVLCHSAMLEMSTRSWVEWRKP
ncbi:hypothetical protein COAQ111491_20065 [Comamonas aquatilis]|uniref:hypothetical protein n=1 Tax=Comamonas aquatilis TaxID=1778406 RepID=UPI0039EF8B6F